MTNLTSFMCCIVELTFCNTRLIQVTVYFWKFIYVLICKSTHRLSVPCVTFAQVSAHRKSLFAFEPKAKMAQMGKPFQVAH